MTIEAINNGNAANQISTAKKGDLEGRKVDKLSNAELLRAKKREKRVATMKLVAAMIVVILAAVLPLFLSGGLAVTAALLPAGSLKTGLGIAGLIGLIGTLAWGVSGKEKKVWNRMTDWADKVSNYTKVTNEYDKLKRNISNEGIWEKTLQDLHAGNEVDTSVNWNSGKLSNEILHAHRLVVLRKSYLELRKSEKKIAVEQAAKMKSEDAEKTLNAMERNDEMKRLHIYYSNYRAYHSWRANELKHYPEELVQSLEESWDQLAKA